MQSQSGMCQHHTHARAPACPRACAPTQQFKPRKVTLGSLCVPGEPLLPLYSPSVRLLCAPLLLSFLPSARAVRPSLSVFSHSPLSLLSTVLGHFPAFFPSPSISAPPVACATERADLKHTRTYTSGCVPVLSLLLSRSLVLYRKEAVRVRVCLRVRVWRCVCSLPSLPRQQQRTSPGARPRS